MSGSQLTRPPPVLHKSIVLIMPKPWDYIRFLELKRNCGYYVVH